MTETPQAIQPAPTEETLEERQKRLAFRSTTLGLIIYVLVRAICLTLRYHKEHFERLTPAEGRSILVTWHGRTLLPAYLLRNRGYWALISLSKDGEMQNRIFNHFGFQSIRGSSSRGGIRGALQMARKVKEGGILTFTPDGPRGPSHKVQLGVILIAEKSGAPIVPCGFSVRRRWLVKSWDSYMVPKPFSRAYIVVGEPIAIPPNLSESERLEWADKIEKALNTVEQEAERRAGHIT